MKPSYSEYQEQTSIGRYTVLTGYSFEDGDYLIIYDANDSEKKITLYGDQIHDLKEIITWG